MGLLVDGVWHDTWYDTKTSNGKFVRSQSQFRSWITADGSPGDTGEGGFAAQKDRYHLYISHACPWAHRTLIFRHLKGLEEYISLSVVDYFMDSEGWKFSDRDGAIPDDVLGKDRVWQIYTEADPNYSGRVTVPVLWDKKTKTIVSNESSEIIRMFNSTFNDLTGNNIDYYPVELRDKIDAINDPIYNHVNNGVYKCGFATTQAAYEEAFGALFETLDHVEAVLGNSRYLVGDRLTEADWRLFTTLVRFDPVYVGHFKCNKRRIVDCPNLSNYLRELYQMQGISDLVNMQHIKNHYYQSHETVNPTRIVPVGPESSLDQPHDRERLTAA